MSSLINCEFFFVVVAEIFFLTVVFIGWLVLDDDKFVISSIRRKRVDKKTHVLCERISPAVKEVQNMFLSRG